MTGVQRRYIRLEEISEKSSLTKGDVYELVEQGKLSFCAYIDLRQLGAVHRKDQTDYLIGVFHYEGIVGLFNSTSQKFVKDEQAHSVEKVLILQPEKIVDWNDVDHHFGPVTKSRYTFVPNVSQPTVPFYAFLKMHVGQSFNQMRTNIFAQYSKVMGINLPSNASKDIDTTSYFQPELKYIQPSQLRVDLTELEKVIGDQTDNVDAPKPESAPVETHPIKLVIKRILVSEGDLTSRQIWHVLRGDIHAESKQFDTDAIIFDMTADDLSYFGLGDTTKNITYRRFQNLVSEVRKNHHG